MLLCIVGQAHAHRSSEAEVQSQPTMSQDAQSYTAKRNLRKAARRASRSEHQCATYKGQTYSAEALRRMAGLTTATPSVLNRRTRSKGPGPIPKSQGDRIKVTTWNSGGLPKDAWMEFQLWLHDQKDYNVIMIQETHWRFSSQFSLPKYHALHSGTADHRHQGCLMLIHKRCCKAEDVRWSPTVGGHLLHVRFPKKQKHIDIVNLYQHCWNNASGIEQLTAKRDKLWFRTQALLSNVPIRNTLILGGDFNTPCGSQGDCVGPGITPSKHPPPDQDQLQRMLMVLRLQVLNSWGKKSKSFTFENGEAKTQIDFIITRSTQADQVARNAKILFDYLVLKW